MLDQDHKTLSGPFPNPSPFWSGGPRPGLTGNACLPICMTNQWEPRWLLVVSSACMSSSYKNSPPCIIFQSCPSACGDTAQVLYPWPRAIDCLVHWSSPVHRLVFSQQGGPVHRSSPVCKLVATIINHVRCALKRVSIASYIVWFQLWDARSRLTATLICYICDMICNCLKTQTHNYL